MEKKTASIPQTGMAGSLPEEDVRAALERMLVSPDFRASERRRVFLKFVVDETLAGRGAALKGFTIANVVFGRDADFDSKTDPVVRLEARRLRQDLDSYYVGPGAADPVRISIPKGGYQPLFAKREIAAPTAVASPGTAEMHRVSVVGDSAPFYRLSARSRWLAASLLGLLLLASIVIGLGTSKNQEADILGLPSVRVAVFNAPDGSETARILAFGVANELVTNLLRFPDFRVFLVPPDHDGDDAGTNRPPAEETRYRVAGEIVAQNGRVRLSAHLVDVTSDRVIWSETYSRELGAEDLVDLQADLGGAIASALGQPYGVVRNHVVDSDNGLRVPAHLESYYCVLKAYQLRRNLYSRERDDVRTCIEATVRRDPGYAEAWAMLGWLELDEARFPAAPPATADLAYERAFVAATKGVALEPGNVQALKALSAINHYSGNYEEGWRLARLALEKNPHDPDTLAQLGWRLAIRGRFAEGVPLLHRAIERTTSPPGWYHTLIAIDQMMRGDFAEMLATARLSASNGGPVSLALIAVAEANLGNLAAAREALARMEELSPAFAADPAANLRIHGATDEIVAAFKEGLELARR